MKNMEQDLVDFFESQAGSNEVKIKIDRNNTSIDFKGETIALKTLVESVPMLQAGLPDDKVGLKQIDLQKLKSENQLKMGISLAVLAFAIVVAILVGVKR